MVRREQLEQAIANLEAQRAILGDATVDTAIAGIKLQLDAITPAPPPETQKQRKHVTILFADVSGFTAMSEMMDAEDVGDTMNALWRDVDAAITEHDGHIDKHIGDAVMALWGVDEAREDDPEQAIRAALAMQEASQTFADERHINLQMRIGLNTGPVLLDQVGTTGEFTAMGDTVNTASRLEHAAPIGGILISHDTYRHVRGVFSVEPQNPLIVRGKSEPLQVYIVKQVKPRTFRVGTRGVEGIETKTIGRDEELQLLQGAYETTTNQRQTMVVTIVGEAGVGKSRLLYEFDKWIELRPELIRYFKGRSAQQAQGVPHYLLRDMLATRFQILDSDPITTVRQKFEAGIAELLEKEATMKAHILGSWLGYDFKDSPHLQIIKDEPEQIKNRATLYLAQYFAALGERQPAIILLEDIHWADEISLDALIDLTRRRPRLPLLIVCVARPSLYQLRPTWGKRIPHHTRIDLHPLTQTEIRALVAEILRLIETPPPILIDLITTRAEGNPFYAEELVKMLIDDGVIVTDDDVWQVMAERLLTLAVPPTLTGVLQARLDKLQPPEKQALQQASVIGRVFWDKALTTLDVAGALALPPLHSKEFIFPRADTAFADTEEYIFKHAILRDVTYETVLKQTRRTYHALVADWLVQAAEANGRTNEYAAVVGEHFHIAQKETEAATWYGRAGQQASLNFAHEEAIRYLTLALQLTSEHDIAARFAYVAAREKTYHMQGNREAQGEDLALMVSLAQALGDLAKAQTALRQAGYAEVTGHFEQAVQHAQQAIAFAQQADEPNLVAGGHNSWGLALMQQGKYLLATAKFEIGLQQAQAFGDQKEAARSLNSLGLIAYELGLYSQSQVYFEQALAIRQEIGDQRGEGISLNNLGVIAYASGHHAQAQAYYEQVLAISQEIGDRRGEGIGLNNLGVIANASGNYTQTQAYYEEVLAISQEIGDQRGVGLVFAGLALVYHQRGQQEMAQQYSQQAITIAREVGSPYILGYALTYLGHALVALAQLNEAITAYQEAYTLRREAEQGDMSMEPLAGLARVAMLQGDKAGALAYAETIYAYLADHELSGAVEDRMRVYLTCYQVLAETADERSEALLETAYHMIQTVAQKQPEEVRPTYLAIPSHAGIVQAWQKRKRLSESQH